MRDDFAQRRGHPFHLWDNLTEVRFGQAIENLVAGEVAAVFHRFSRKYKSLCWAARPSGTADNINYILRLQRPLPDRRLVGVRRIYCVHAAADDTPVLSRCAYRPSTLTG